MNKLVLALIIMLGLGALVFCLYKSRLLTAAQAQYAALTAPRNPPAVEVSCNCAVITPISMPTPKQAQADEKAEERQDAIENKKVVLRLHRLIYIGMPRSQVKQRMGEPDMDGSSIAAGHPGDEADYYGDYEVVYSAQGTVTWFGSF